MQTQIQVMLDLQNAMNTRVHPQWEEQGYEWYRAIWVECAELMDHHGWKWWKKQSPDLDQVKLELVDIWHFGLSALLTEKVSAEDIAQQLQNALSVPASDFKFSLDGFAEKTLLSRGFSIEAFAPLLTIIEMPFDELYTAYIGKNVLNFFRQDNGYKDGSYQKNWAGKEDNEHLVELVGILDSSQADFKDILYQALSERYQKLCVA